MKDKAARKLIEELTERIEKLERRPEPVTPHLLYCPTCKKKTIQFRIVLYVDLFGEVIYDAYSESKGWGIRERGHRCVVCGSLIKHTEKTTSRTEHKVIKES